MAGGEPNGRSIRRELLAQLDGVSAGWRDPKLSDKRVHDLRKTLKRSRAGMRVLRAALGERTYRQCNLALRDVARPLTPIRDNKVLRKTAHKLMAKRHGPALATLQRSLDRQYDTQRKRLPRTRPGNTLREVRAQIQALPAGKLAQIDIAAALARAYKKARTARRRAQRTPSDACLHEWRKQTKYWLYQLRLAQPLKPKRLGTLIDRARILTDILGNDHDLAVLRATLEAQPARPDRQLLRKLQRKRERLQRKARRRGKKLFRARPRIVAVRLATSKLG